MSKRLVLVCWVLICSASSPLAQRHPAAEQALNRAEQALGLSERTLSTLVAEGVYTQINSERTVSYPFTVKFSAPDRVRCEARAQEGPTVTVITGNRGWSRTGGGPLGRLSLGQVQGRGIEFFPAALVQQWRRNPDFDLPELAGATRAGRNLELVDALQRGPAGQDTEEIYQALTQKTLVLDGLPLSLVYRAASGDWRRGADVELVYSDFQQIEGILFPMTVTAFTESRALFTIQWTAIDLNVPILESDFLE